MPRPEQTPIFLTFADDTVGVMWYITKSYYDNGTVHWEKELTPEGVQLQIERLHQVIPARQVPVKRWRITTEAEVPTDRTYRNAWRDTGTSIVHDMVHARNLHRDMLREARTFQFTELDLEYMKADELDDKETKKRVVAERQRLRDITKHPAIEAAQTIEDLKAVGVDSLIKNPNVKP